MKKLRKISASDMRLLLAAVLCVAVLFVSSDSTKCKDLGKVVFVNNSEIRANVTISGPQTASTVVEGQSSAALLLKPGSYDWKALEIGTMFGGGQMNTGGCIVEKDKTVSVNIGFN